MLDSARRESPSAGTQVADAFDHLEVFHAGGEELLQRAEMVYESIDNCRRQARDAGEQSVAARRERAVERVDRPDP